MPTPILAIVGTATLAIALAGCGETTPEAAEPAAAVDAAESTAPPTDAEPAPAALPAGALALDTASSKVDFTGAKITAKHQGGFERIEGFATLDGVTVTALEVTVHTASVWTDGSDRLTAHLRDADFFDAANHPTATFAATELKPLDGGEATHRVTGDLTLRGVTKTLTFDATLAVNDGEVLGKATFPIDRQDYGIAYPGKPDDLIKDEVELRLDLTFRV